MERITKSHGKATARFVEPVRARAVARWTPAEQQIIDDAIERNLTLAETCELIPYRSYHSVKDRYYRSHGWNANYHEDDEGRLNSNLPSSLYDARRQKDAREGSAKLLNALRAAGFVVDTGKAA